MIYTELDKIPLSRFIDVFLGDMDKVSPEGEYSREEKEKAAERLCNEYLSIVGGKSVSAHIGKRNDVLKIQMRLSCLGKCTMLMKMGEWETVNEVLSVLGYRFKSEEHDRMRARIESVMASDKYRLAKLMESPTTSAKTKMDREYFVRERVAVMSHVKMYIDEDVFSAKEYAYLVRNMCEEMDAMVRATKKK